MSREVKFRAINADGDWCYGLPYYDADGDLDMSLQSGYSDYGDIEKTLGQYTGLKDKNGVECYEGDIVKMYYQPMHEFGHKEAKVTKFKSTGFNEYTAIGEMLDVRVVKWLGGALMLCCDNGATGYVRSFNNLANPGESFEVIGNIHQNPELLD